MLICGEGHIFKEPVLLLEDYWDRGEKIIRLSDMWRRI